MKRLSKYIYWAWTNYTEFPRTYPVDKDKIQVGQPYHLEQTLKDTKRSKTSENIRQPILQKGTNPFMNNNYLEHLETEQKFLRAKSSND